MEGAILLHSNLPVSAFAFLLDKFFFSFSYEWEKKIVQNCELPFSFFLVKTQHGEMQVQLLVLEIVNIFWNEGHLPEICQVTNDLGLAQETIY